MLRLIVLAALVLLAHAQYYGGGGGRGAPMYDQRAPEQMRQQEWGQPRYDRGPPNNNGHGYGQAHPEQARWGGRDDRGPPMKRVQDDDRWGGGRREQQWNGHHQQRYGNGGYARNDVGGRDYWQQAPETERRQAPRGEQVRYGRGNGFDVRGGNDDDDAAGDGWGRGYARDEPRRGRGYGDVVEDRMETRGGGGRGRMEEERNMRYVRDEAPAGRRMDHRDQPTRVVYVREADMGGRGGRMGGQRARVMQRDDMYGDEDMEDDPEPMEVGQRAGGRGGGGGDSRELRSRFQRQAERVPLDLKDDEAQLSGGDTLEGLSSDEASGGSGNRRQQRTPTRGRMEMRNDMMDDEEDEDDGMQSDEGSGFNNIKQGRHPPVAPKVSLGVGAKGRRARARAQSNDGVSSLDDDDDEPMSLKELLREVRPAKAKQGARGGGGGVSDVEDDAMFKQPVMGKLNAGNGMRLSKSDVEGVSDDEISSDESLRGPSVTTTTNNNNSNKKKNKRPAKATQGSTRNDGGISDLALSDDDGDAPPPHRSRMDTLRETRSRSRKQMEEMEEDPDAGVSDEDDRIEDDDVVSDEDDGDVDVMSKERKMTADPLLDVSDVSGDDVVIVDDPMSDRGRNTKQKLAQQKQKQQQQQRRRKDDDIVVSDVSDVDDDPMMGRVSDDPSDVEDDVHDKLVPRTPRGKSLRDVVSDDDDLVPHDATMAKAKAKAKTRAGVGRSLRDVVSDVSDADDFIEPDPEQSNRMDAIESEEVPLMSDERETQPPLPKRGRKRQPHAVPRTAVDPTIAVVEPPKRKANPRAKPRPKAKPKAKAKAKAKATQPKPKAKPKQPKKPKTPPKTTGELSGRAAYKLSPGQKRRRRETLEIKLLPTDKNDFVVFALGEPKRDAASLSALKTLQTQLVGAKGNLTAVEGKLKQVETLDSKLQAQFADMLTQIGAYEQLMLQYHAECLKFEISVQRKQQAATRCAGKSGAKDTRCAMLLKEAQDVEKEAEEAKQVFRGRLDTHKQSLESTYGQQMAQMSKQKGMINKLKRPLEAKRDQVLAVVARINDDLSRL